MKSFLVIFAFGVLFTAVGLSQDKDKSCCSGEKTKTSMSKTCEDSNEMSLSSSGEENKLVSIQVDDKNKKIEKNTKNSDKHTSTTKSKVKTSEDGCCTTDKKKTEKVKPPKQ